MKKIYGTKYYNVIITIGKYTISRFDDDTIWITNNKEGMFVKEKRLEKVIEKLFVREL